jgi:hypothetical protein
LRHEVQEVFDDAMEMLDACLPLKARHRACYACGASEEAMPKRMWAPVCRTCERGSAMGLSSTRRSWSEEFWAHKIADAWRSGHGPMRILMKNGVRLTP